MNCITKSVKCGIMKPLGKAVEKRRKKKKVEGDEVQFGFIRRRMTDEILFLF